MPAQFGRPWPVEIEFSATLQLPNDNWMCKDTMTNSTDEKLPAANPPLALLVERGNCTVSFIR